MEISNFYSSSDGSEIVPMMMIGVVTNNNDPQQMGRVQVYVPALSEHQQHVIEDQLPWASYVSPIGGIDERSARGPAKPGQNVNSPYGDKSAGAVSYGMWAIPKVGTRVIVVAIDNDPNQLYYIGCVFDNSTTHTMPHGRYITDAPDVDQGPDGPLTSTEQPIEPLYTNTLKAFGDHENYEWRTRGADYSVAAISPTRLASDIESDTNENHTGTVSKRLDDRDTEIVEDDGQIVGKDVKFRQGYALSRSDPSKVTNDEYHDERNKRTDRNLEPTVTSITTPGFHAISMDDRPENCRMRFRTATGHQMIMDDTNERIYVSTSEGRNWIEMDSDGNIMVYSQQSVAIRAEGDLNLTSDAKIRMTAKDGIHMKSGAEFRLHADERADIVFEKDLKVHVRDGDAIGSDVVFDGDLRVHNKENVDWLINKTLKLEVNETTDFKFDQDWKMTSGANVDFNISSNFNITSGIGIDISTSALKSMSESYDINVSNSFKIKSSPIDIDAGTFKVDGGGNIETAGSAIIGGVVTCAGLVVANGGLTASGGGISVKGTITSTGDMFASDFKTPTSGLNSHTHLYYPGSMVGPPSTPTEAGTGGGGGGPTQSASSAPSEPASPSPVATAATSGSPSVAQEAYEAFWTILTPSHEPWGRNFHIDTDNDFMNTHTMLELDNDSPNVGRDLRIDYTITTPANNLTRLGDRERNPLWHR